MPADKTLLAEVVSGLILLQKNFFERGVYFFAFDVAVQE
jgi:hypothetical protein